MNLFLVNPRKNPAVGTPEVVQPPTHPGGRERTDLLKSFVSMPQIGSEPFASSGASSVSDLRKSSEEKMSTGSDNQATTNNDVHHNNNNYDEESQSDDFVDSCSCTGIY